MQVEIKNLPEVEALIKALPRKTFDAAKKIFSKHVLAAHADVSSNLSGGPLFSRTGLLRKSLRPEVTGTTLATLHASVYAAGSVKGVPVVYAPIHEAGGIVKAKRAYLNVPGGPYLNIPTSANKTPAGVMRYSPATIFKQGGFIVKGPKGWCVMKGNAVGSATCMFVLRKEVTIKPRLGLVRAGEKRVPALLQDLGRAVKELGQ